MIIDSNALAAIIGLGVPTVSSILQTYVALRKSNVEKYFQMLVEENKDLTQIGENERLQNNFMRIIDYVSKETTDEKIRNWKNLTIKLATGFEDLDFTENYTSILDNLTPFDLTVLFSIYSTDFESQYFNKEIFKFFQDRNINKAKVLHSIKRLATHNLVSEESYFGADTRISNRDNIIGEELVYKKNDLGPEFIKIINS